MKAKFLEQQPAVKFTVQAGKVYVYVCVNEEEVIEVDAEGNKTTSYQYDYNEFFDDIDNVDRSAIRENPDAYVDYDPNKKVDLYAAIEELTAQNTALEEALAEAQANYDDVMSCMIELMEDDTEEE